MIEPLQHWIAVHVGIGPSARSLYWYSFWSGFGSDLAEVTLIAAAIGAFRAINCHQTRCWRIGKHQIVGGRFKVCKKHHPDIPQTVTAEHIAREHVAHLARTSVPKPVPAQPRKPPAKATKKAVAKRR